MARMSEKVVLPSNGLPYANHKPKELTVQNLTVDELSYLVGSTSNAIDDILKSCIKEDIDMKSLIIPDKHYLLVKARVLTYGQDMPLYPSCPEHGEFKHVVNLNTLPVNELTPEEFDPNWEITLPVSGDKVNMMLPTGSIYDEGEDYIENKMARYPTMDESRLRYKVNKCMSIAKVNGAPMSLDELVIWMGELHAKDGQYLDHQLGKIEVGYDTLIVAKCPKCGRVVKVRLGITPDFFHSEFED